MVFNDDSEVTVSPEFIVSIGNLGLLLFNAVVTANNRRLNDKLEDLRQQVSVLQKHNDDLERQAASLQVQITQLTEERITLYRKLAKTDV